MNCGIGSIMLLILSILIAVKSPDILTAAYEECVNQKSKFSMSYVAKILENWHKNGDKPTESKKETKNNFATHDLDLFEKMLNSKD